MNRFRSGVFALLVIFGLGFMIAAKAEVVQTHYTTLRDGLPAKSHNAVSSADATTWATALNPKATDGNPTVIAFCEFSTASATCVLECGLYYKNSDGTYTYIGPAAAKATVTAAASGNTDGSLYPNLAPTTFDTRGAPYYDLRITSISTNTVTCRPWVYGAKSHGQ